MIIQGEALVDYLLRTDGWENNYQSRTVRKLQNWKTQQELHGLSPIEHLFLEHQAGNRSMRQLAKETGICIRTITGIFKSYNFPTKTQSEATKDNWEDEDFRRRNAEAVKKNWKDEDFRRRNADATKKNWEDEDFRRRNADATKKNWEDEDFRRRNADATKKNWEDEDFRRRNADANKKMLNERWKDEDFRNRQSEAVKKNWKDEDFRRRNAEGIRGARANPENNGKFYVPTIKGFRKDLGIETYSAWEANLGRAILKTGREIISRESLTLKVRDEFRDLFNSDITQISLDYLTLDKRGNFIGYELLVYPISEEVRRAKVKMASEQYGIRIVPITKKFYKRLEKRFRNRINQDPRFSGWETREDNLETNPDKYSI